jgi:predicted aspartyl protease
VARQGPHRANVAPWAGRDPPLSPLLDTGATHAGLTEIVIEQLGLTVAFDAVSMTVLGSGQTHDVSLYVLRLAQLENVLRHNLTVVPIVLPEVSGYHGVLGMNWLRTFAHIGLVHLQTDRPVLELHDPT